MLNKLSLRLRLTLLSALVMAGAAVLLTGLFLFGADRIFVRDLQQEFEFQPGEITITGDSGVMGEDAGIITFTLKKAGNQFNLWALAGLFPVLALGTGAAWLVAGRALKPLGDLSDTIEEISGNDLSRRVEIGDRQDEIGRLAQSFNHMMDKVSASFERQKRFSASAAHELKTPLSTILVNLEVMDLDESPSAERMEKVLSVVKVNTERMIRLVNDLFQLTSEKNGEMSEKMMLGEIFEIALEELAPLLQKKNLTVTVRDMADLNLTGSRVMIYRAMSNLIENAAKYNREGGSISIAAERMEQRLTVRIADTGIGIPEEDLPHIFEPFYRVDRSRSRAVGGAGLGLPLVRDIIEKHGGSIEVKSVPGEGSEFIIELPAM